MTSIDLSAYDLKSPTDRSILADHLDDVGRTAEAARVRENRYELVEGRFMARLSAEDRQEAIWAFVDCLYPDGAPDDWDEDENGVWEEWRAEYISGCTVHYKDDLETGESWYEVVDAQGHGDGSGEWTPVEAE